MYCMYTIDDQGQTDVGILVEPKVETHLTTIVTVLQFRSSSHRERDTACECGECVCVCCECVKWV